MGEIQEQSKTLQEHLKIIVDACKELQPDLTAIILYGGFGRDEGSWFQDESGKYRPYNDYDIKIVSCRKIPEKPLETLKKELAKKIGINWIDLGQFHPQEMKRLRPSILNYDLKNASRVIYGNETVLDLIPYIDNTALPMKEIATLYFTRLYTLLGSLEENGLNVKLEGEKSRFFRNQMAKAILAVVDVVLLVKGAYDASYHKRTERVAKLYPEKEELLKLTQWALAEKLRPQAPAMQPHDVCELYKLVHKHYLIEMYQGMSMCFGKAVNGPEDIELYMKYLPIAMMKRLWWLGRFRNLRAERQLAIKLAQSYIASAWSLNGINENKLSRGIALLRQVDSRVLQKMTWDNARLEAARLRMVV